MKASDLIDKEVVTSDGKPLGHVFELELQRTGPHVSGILGNALRVTALLVSERGGLLRLGFLTSEMQGPHGLAQLARRSTGIRVPWTAIDDIGEARITVDGSRVEEL